MLDSDVSCVAREKGGEKQEKNRGSQVIVYGSLGSLLTPRFVECISFWLRNRCTLSVPESLERHDGPLFLLYCSGPGLTPRSGVVSTVAVTPVAGQPRTASSCKSLLTTIPNALQAERC
jgi:hypothetical protein